MKKDYRRNENSYSKNQVPELEKNWSFLSVISTIFIFFVSRHSKIIS